MVSKILIMKAPMFQFKTQNKALEIRESLNFSTVKKPNPILLPSTFFLFLFRGVIEYLLYPRHWVYFKNKETTSKKTKWFPQSIHVSWAFFSFFLYDHHASMYAVHAVSCYITRKIRIYKSQFFNNLIKVCNEIQMERQNA